MSAVLNLKTRRGLRSSRLPSQHLETVLARVTDAVVAVDISNRVTYMNDAAKRLFACGQRDPNAVSLTKLMAPVELVSEVPVANLVEAAMRRGLAGTPRRVVLAGERCGAAVTEYSIEVLRNAGTISGAVIIFSDITHRLAAERALRDSEAALLKTAEAMFQEKERSAVTLNSIGDAVISTDFSGRVSFINRAAEAMTGWSQAEAAGQLLDEIFILSNAESRQFIACPTISAVIEDRKVAVGAPCIVTRRDRTQVAVEVSASPIHDTERAVLGAVMVAHDVTAARDLSAKLARLALHDNLTGLPNRALFTDRLEAAVLRARRIGSCAAVLFIDLDRFKPVNDSLGHAVGDQLLKSVAQRMLGTVRSSDTVSRYGGDEFVILLAEITHPQDASLYAAKLKAAFNTPFEICGHQLLLTASIGIACFPQSTSIANELVECADTAMYESKLTGRNSYRLFSGKRKSRKTANLRAPDPR